jgi:hypothetical protein
MSAPAAGKDESQKRSPAFGGDPLKAQIEAWGHFVARTTATCIAKAGPEGRLEGWRAPAFQAKTASRLSL